ncbi:MAG: acyl carrier protein [Sandaracinaceae bacterium]
MASDLETRVTELVARTITESSGREVALTPETALITSGFLDSLTVLQLFGSLQEEFEVELDMDDLTETHFETASAIAALIEERT